MTATQRKGLSVSQKTDCSIICKVTMGMFVGFVISTLAAMISLRLLPLLTLWVFLASIYAFCLVIVCGVKAEEGSKELPTKTEETAGEDDIFSLPPEALVVIFFLVLVCTSMYTISHSHITALWIVETVKATPHAVHAWFKDVIANILDFLHRSFTGS